MSTYVNFVLGFSTGRHIVLAVELVSLAHRHLPAYFKQLKLFPKSSINKIPISKNYTFKFFVIVEPEI